MRINTDSYIWKQQKEISDESNAINALYYEVSSMIERGELEGLKEKFDLLHTKQVNFPAFQKEREDRINEYISNNIKDIISLVEKENIKYIDGGSMDLAFAMMLAGILSKDFEGITKSYGTHFSCVLSDDVGKKYTDFIMELYSYTGSDIRFLYNNSNFSKLPDNVKSEVFKSKIFALHTSIREQEDYFIKSESKELYEMLYDTDIQDFLKTHPKINVVAEQTANLANKYYPASDEIFESDNKSMPIELKYFINAFSSQFQDKELEQEVKEDISL